MTQHEGRSEYPAPEVEPARAFIDFYRCPAEFAPFEVRTARMAAKGFFRVGSAICYGNISAGNAANAPTGDLFDAASAVKISGECVSLCFDPTEVVENLRRERYMEASRSAHVLRKSYYSFRPGLPFRVRTALQRLVFRRRRMSFPHWPVDCSVEQIFESLMRLVVEGGGRREIPFIWFWPDRHHAASILTHDVEEESGAAYCETLMDLDDSFGLKAAFQFVPEGRYERVDQLIARARRRGFEANLHDLNHDGRMYLSFKRFQRRAVKINAYAQQYGVRGFRAGSMHRNQDWFDVFEFEYDMSVPTVSHLEPQRGGCCTVMPYFVGKVLELPLTTIQDHGLFYILRERSIDLWKQQIKTISSHHGLMSFIIHPDYIVPGREHSLYIQLLHYLQAFTKEENIWVTLPGDVSRWWRERSQMRLIREGKKWCIRGRGSERASVAYARIADGNLAYFIEATTRDFNRAHTPCSRATGTGHEQNDPCS
jgi:hypothetical protein